MRSSLHLTGVTVAPASELSCEPKKPMLINTPWNEWSDPGGLLHTVSQHTFPGISLLIGPRLMVDTYRSLFPAEKQS